MPGLVAPLVDEGESLLASRTVHPLGLVVKNNTWYLVAGTAAGLAPSE